jgi:hypothetical protein
MFCCSRVDGAFQILDSGYRRDRVVGIVYLNGETVERKQGQRKSSVGIGVDLEKRVLGKDVFKQGCQCKGC